MGPEPRASHYQDRYHNRVLRNLKRRAKSLGYYLQDLPKEADMAVSKEATQFFACQKPHSHWRTSTALQLKRSFYERGVQSRLSLGSYALPGRV